MPREQKVDRDDIDDIKVRDTGKGREEPGQAKTEAGRGGREKKGGADGAI